MIDPNATLSRLEELNLEGMVQAYRDSLHLPPAERRDPDELVAGLAEAEYLKRASRVSARTSAYWL